jgi:hypothetical protein
MIRTKSTTRIVVGVCGADTRIGSRLVTRLTEAGLGVLPRPSDWSLGVSVDELKRYFGEKYPSVLVNCLIDPDSGELPKDVSRYVTTSRSLVKYSQSANARYVHVSSSRLYGPQDFPEARGGFAEYDTALADCGDVWRQLVASVERSILHETTFANPVAAKRTEDKFGFYVTRFAHVLSYDEACLDRYAELFTLPAMLKELTQKSVDVVCDGADAPISPISLQFAVECLVDLCQPRCALPYGFYNIGATTATTVRRLCMELTKRFGNFATMHGTGNNDRYRQLSGVDSMQAVNSALWVRRGMRRPPACSDSIRALLSSSMANV